MARQSGRPGSRQSSTAPQETATAGRATRSTRSQSREPNEQPTLQRASGRGKKGGAKKGKNAAAELTTVDEDAADEEELEAERSTERARAENVAHVRRASVYSGMSGTTAKTSFSQEEIQDLDRDVMVDLLPSLSSAAEELSRLLVPADLKSRPVVRKEIRTVGTKHNKLYNNRIASIDLHKGHFGSTEYLQPSIVLRALLGVQNIRDVPEATWRPDGVIYKINLASMLKCILISFSENESPPSVGAYNLLEALDLNFASAIAGPEFSNNAFEMCMATVTHLCIHRLEAYQADPYFKPSDIVTLAFYAKDADGDLTFRHRNVLHMMQLPPGDQERYTDMIRQNVDQMVAIFDDDNPATWDHALHTLKVQFKWQQFVDHAIDYYLERKQELDEQIAAVGGIDQIMIGLAEEVQRREEARIAEAKRQSFSRPGGTPKKGFGKGAIKVLKARAKQLEASSAPAPPTAPVAPMVVEPAAPPVDNAFQGQDDDDQIGPPPKTAAESTARSTLEALSSLQDVQRQNAAKGKGRSFVDRQEGAQRVEFDDNHLTQDLAPPAFRYPASSSREQGPYFPDSQRNAAKRPYDAVDEEPEEFEPTQDQGFEVDTRDTTAADQRRREAPEPTQRLRQPRFSAAPENDFVRPFLRTAHASASPSPSKRQRRNPGSTIPDPPPPFDPDQYTEIPRDQRMYLAKVAARHHTIRATQTKPAKARQPWSIQEENALHKLIEEEGEEGISYAKLKKYDDHRPEGPALEKRNAEDLRFKARNMKQTYLAGRSALPRNFEHIVLDKKAIDRLRTLGVPYHQERMRGGAEVTVMGEVEMDGVDEVNE
ncbi:hypothetical protein LTR37_021423 [Vermiconidia calcicola]|uniref:Uncharacterized protein n=1 Tax=Vermiconidia calcicola TaxID=1690605 RepID=A0ACC3M8Q9_9PEZI|nr:hypothetical protein LTR37_021423 [Vermiconidia calcicola]